MSAHAIQCRRDLSDFLLLLADLLAPLFALLPIALVRRPGKVPVPPAAEPVTDVPVIVPAPTVLVAGQPDMLPGENPTCPNSEAATPCEAIGSSDIGGNCRNEHVGQVGQVGCRVEKETGAEVVYVRRGDGRGARYAVATGEDGGPRFRRVLVGSGRARYVPVGGEGSEP